MKKLVRLLLFLIILLLIASVAGLFYWNRLISPLDANGNTKAFVVQRGEGVNNITKRLVSEGFARSDLALKILLRTSFKNVKIEAGDFKLSPAMSAEELLKTLSEGSIDKWVTIVEGQRVEEVAEVLNKELGVNKKLFLDASEEGYMFPDTYLFNPDATAADIASVMRNTFDKRYDTKLQQKIKAQGLTPEEGVILASLVEREGRSEKVRTQVAGIMLKRLNIGMKLDIDATVQYAKDSQKAASGQGLKKYWLPITRDDYTGVKSTYNTYLNPGLPPGPICNPSLASLNAVANADPKTPYLYYYHDSKGNSYYSRTLEEHNEAVANHR